MVETLLGHDRSEVAPRAVAPDRDPAGVDTEVGGVCMRPAEGRDSVVDRRRKAVLRRQSVVDIEDRDARLSAQEATARVMRVDVTEHPATAVEVDEQGQRPLALDTERAVQPGRYAARRAGDRQVTGRADGGRVACEHPRPQGHLPAGLGHEKLVELLVGQASEDLQADVGVRVEAMTVDDAWAQVDASADGLGHTQQRPEGSALDPVSPSPLVGRHGSILSDDH